MKKDNSGLILSASARLTRLIQVICVFLLGAIGIVTIIYFVDKQVLSEAYLEPGKLLPASMTDQKISLASLTTFGFLFQVFRSSIALVFFILIFKTFHKVITSVSRAESFRVENVTSFRRIGFYFIAMWLISLVNVIDTHTVSKATLNMEFTFVYFALLALVMSEVFKQGNKLQEENQLTV